MRQLDHHHARRSLVQRAERASKGPVVAAADVRQARGESKRSEILRQASRPDRRTVPRELNADERRREREERPGVPVGVERREGATATPS
jgi:hypothetical protein